jgi:hypothetical protein
MADPCISRGALSVVLSAFRRLAAGLALAFLAAYAAAASYYAFDFRPLEDSPGIRVLDWRYGDRGPAFGERQE